MMSSGGPSGDHLDLGRRLYGQYEAQTSSFLAEIHPGTGRVLGRSVSFGSVRNEAGISV